MTGIAPPAHRTNLLVPDAERWPLDADKPVIELVDASISFRDNRVLEGLSLKLIAVSDPEK